MKFTRLIVGFVVILFALWVIVGEQMARTSANAFVNAPIVTVRSDVAGTLELVDRPPGARVNAGEVVASITDPLVDTIRLNDLVMERTFEEAARARIAAQREAQRGIQGDLDARGESFRENRLDELRTRLEHARARLALLEDGTDPETRRLGDALDSDGARLPAEPDLESLALDYARERVEVLEIELRAAEAGVFLGDGYNDSPNAAQRATELDSVIATLDAEHAEAEARVAAVAERIDRERVRVNALTGGDLASPVDGLLWEVLEADGVVVQRGDPLLRLVDCASLVVSLSVPEGTYNGLRLGDAARFRFENETRLFDATVTRLAGSGAATVYEHLAVAPSQRHLERYDVTLLVPELSQDPELGCPVGRTGRVFFEDRPLDGLRGLFGG